MALTWACGRPVQAMTAHRARLLDPAGSAPRMAVMVGYGMARASGAGSRGDRDPRTGFAASGPSSTRQRCWSAVRRLRTVWGDRPSASQPCRTRSTSAAVMDERGRSAPSAVIQSSIWRARCLKVGIALTRGRYCWTAVARLSAVDPVSLVRSALFCGRRLACTLVRGIAAGRQPDGVPPRRVARHRRRIRPAARRPGSPRSTVEGPRPRIASFVVASEPSPPRLPRSIPYPAPPVRRPQRVSSARWPAIALAVSPATGEANVKPPGGDVLPCRA